MSAQCISTKKSNIYILLNFELVLTGNQSKCAVESLLPYKTLRLIKVDMRTLITYLYYIGMQLMCSYQEYT